MPFTLPLSAYAAPSDVSEYLPNVNAAANSAVWTKFASRASRFIDRQTGNYFGQSVGTFLLTGGGRRSFLLPYPLVSLTSLSVAYYTGGPQSIVSAGQFFLKPDQPEAGMPYQSIDLSNIPTQGQSTRFWNGMQNISVTGTWGYPAVPDDIIHLTCKMVARWWKARDAGWSGVIGSIDTGLTTMKMIDTEDRMILDYHTRTAFGFTEVGYGV